MRKDKDSDYELDRRLPPRVRAYLASTGSSNIDAETVVKHLQEKYMEYRRKKRRPFIASIEKILNQIEQPKPVDNFCESVLLKVQDYLAEQKIVKVSKVDKKAVVKYLQEKYCEEYSKTKPTELTVAVWKALDQIKAGKINDSPSGKNAAVTTDLLGSNPPLVVLDKDESDSFSSNNDQYRVYEDGNMVNKSLTQLYGSKNSEPLIVEDPTTEAQTRENDSNGNRLKRKNAQVSDGSFLKKRKKEKEPPFENAINIEKSAVTFANIGGCESQLVEVCKLLMHLKHPEIYSRLGVTPPKGFLLHGPPGCGKTLLANAIAGELYLPFIKIASTELVSGVSGESEEKMRQLFVKAKQTAPCVLFLDEIDAITPKRETAQREMEKRIVSQLLTCLDELDVGNASGTEASKSDETGNVPQKQVDTCPKHVLVIGATNRPDALDPALRRAGRFDKEIALGIPDELGRTSILEVLCKNLKLEPGFSLKALARLTPGYVGADLNSLMREATLVAVDRIFEVLAKDSSADKTTESELDKILSWLKNTDKVSDESLDGLCISFQDFSKALKCMHPSAKREGFATVPDVSWDDIGALQDVREDLKWSILYPVKCPEEFERLGLASRPQGILLCGPPGCGKTLLAKAVANETGMNFISVKGPELLSMYVGESEKAVRQVFQRARNSAPCVIFFDELDALCPKRGNSDSGGSVRVVNQLLTEMDGIEERKQVFIMGATNRPDIVDPAILRPGRLDKIVYVGFPSPNDRHDILRAITKNGTRPPLGRDVTLGDLAQDQRMCYFSGADVAALVHEAALSALQEHLKAKSFVGIADIGTGEVMIDMTEKSDGGLTEVCGRHFETALGRVKPSVSETERKRYEALKEMYTRRS